LGTLGRWVMELFAMYATDGQTDRQTDGQTDGQKQSLLPLPYGLGHNNPFLKLRKLSYVYQN